MRVTVLAINSILINENDEAVLIRLEGFSFIQLLFLRNRNKT